MRQSVRFRMPVDENAAPRGAMALVRTKHEAERQWFPKFEKDIIEGRDPCVAPARVADQAAFTVGGCMDEYLKSHVPQLKAQASATSALNVLRVHLGALPLTGLEHPSPIEDFRRAFKDRNQRR